MQEMTNEFYERIQNEMKNAIDRLPKESDDEKVLKSMNIAIKTLKKIEDTANNEYEKLKKHSEWNTFTIAFYGETNAGKSTIIESLRIYLKEKTKLDQQEKFYALRREMRLGEKELEEISKRIEICDEKINKMEEFLSSINVESSRILLADVKNKNNILTILYKINVENLQKIIETIEKIEYLIEDLEEVKEINRSAFSAVKKFIYGIFDRKKHQKIYSIKDLIEYYKKNKNNYYDIKEKNIRYLRQYADGVIIGDGRPDFTKENTSFEFECKGKKFVLIDVPGIEGKEQHVRKPIEEAVQKAHAVFYVTREPRPPQTSDGKNKGTLEKIKEHLNSQTEVWAIFNRPVKNPRVLENSQIDEDTKGGLEALDAKLKETLPDNYQGNLVISARPAFLAISECLVSESNEEKEKKKLFRKIPEKEVILERSGMYEFVKKISDEIVDIDNYKKKISNSNAKKAKIILSSAISDLEVVHKDIHEQRCKIHEAAKHIKEKIYFSFQTVKNDLDREKVSFLENLKQKVRKDAYNEIEKNINNKVLKERFEKILKDNLKEKSEELDMHIKNRLSVLEKDIRRDSNNAQKSYRRINKFHSKKILPIMLQAKMKIQIDNSIDTKKIIKKIAVAALVAFFSVQIAIITISIEIILELFEKLLSDSKKRQRQKASIDKNLVKIMEGIDSKISDILLDINREIDNKRSLVIAELVENPMKQIGIIEKTLQIASDQLLCIANAS